MEDGEKERVRKEELLIYLKNKKKREMRQSRVLPDLYLWRRHQTVDRPLLSQLLLKPWLNSKAGFGQRLCRSPANSLWEQPETNTACLSGPSVQLLAASIKCVHPPHLPPHIQSQSEWGSFWSELSIKFQWYQRKKKMSVKERMVHNSKIP